VPKPAVNIDYPQKHNPARLAAFAWPCARANRAGSDTEPRWRPEPTAPAQQQGARPIGIELAIGKARSAAHFQEPTQALETSINTGRPAAITAERIQMQGGLPIRIGGTVVGAVGVSGFDKAKDVEIAETAAAALK
jgi:hypothetical protein